MKLALVTNTAWYAYNFRRNLLHALREAGHEVVVLAGADDYSDRLRTLGWPVHDIGFTGSGTQPLREAATVVALRRALREHGVQAVLSYTPKGNLYTALAGVGLQVAQIVNVSGLGRAFVQRNWITPAVERLYRWCLARAHQVFFQNEDDQREFERLGIVERGRSLRLPGSGVDLQHFVPAALPAGAARSPEIRVLMVARLLWEKGLAEYIEAARTLRAERLPLRFALIGAIDEPARGPTRSQIDEWHAEGVIEYLGFADDIRPHLSAADAIVLPSYREGVPRSLLEGAAMALPVIATDVPGCRDCVLDGLNGWLVRPRDSADLADKLRAFVALS
ncbi:MAG: glycosyltransferase family 4 protein, partial [Rubrivivax sp.]